MFFGECSTRSRFEIFFKVYFIFCSFSAFAKDSADSLRSNGLRLVSPAWWAGPCQPKLVRAKAGGDNEIRTRDLLHAMQTRYQLRYIPI